MKIVGITACAAGIAHTYMAQAAIEEAAKELGIEAKVEAQGTIGTENELTSKEIDEADLVIIAADINIDKGRFGGKKLVEIDTNTVLKDPQKVIQDGLQNATVFGAKGTKINGNIEIGTSSNKFVRYLMSGLTDMIPVTIAAGLLLAIANAMAFHPDPNNADLVVWGFQETTSGEFFSKLFDLGKVGFTLMIPIFAAGVARAIGDKPAVAPTFIAGYIINDPTFLKTETGAGFIGAILVGFGVGYLVKMLKKIPYPHLLKPVVPILIIPLIATFISFVIIYYLIGRPIAAGMNGLYDVINHVTVAYAAAPILYGAILGGMMGAAIAVAPLGAGIATLLFKKYFTTEERALGSSALVMGMVGVTEGDIPFAAANPSLIIANTISSAISGGLVASMGIQFYGGVGSPLGAFVGYTTGPKLSWLLWIVAILFASLVNAFLYRFFLRKRTITPKEVEYEVVTEK
ncbi:PTS fructose transporter subunit IIABC [Enterococcus faecium]|nr:PTS fructose transporter subunit IIABC [Enterococcus faecium]EME3556661.1 PTS transporter subunit EIIC [Enterococcus faecium]